MTPPPRLAGTAARETVRATFVDAAYTEAGLEPIVGPDVAARQRLRWRVEIARGFGGRTAQGLLARLFLAGLPATRDEVLDLLGRDRADAFRQAGLLTGDAECRGTVAVTPVGERLMAHDRRDAHQRGAAEFVPGPAPATRRFAELAIRRPGARVLDLGCGQGLLAVLAAEQGGQVTAADINPRAVAFAAFNAALNGLDNITCVHGDLFAPVAGRSFDLILANPPFVISPDATFLYRDARGICERIARDAPSFLAADGILQMVCNWPCHRGHDGRDGLSAWFRDTGCDVWVLQTDRIDAATYAGIWLGQAHEDPVELAPELDRWVTFYDASGIDAVAVGVVAMRRRTPGGSTTPPWFEIRSMPPANGPCGDTIARVLEAREWLARHDDAALLAARVAMVPEARAVVAQHSSTSGWVRESAEIRLTRGLAMAVRLDHVGTALAGFLDGTRTVRGAIEVFAAAAGVPADALLPGAPALVRRLVGLGLVVGVH
jgi:SAM-dependent methyltransferase